MEAPAFPKPVSQTIRAAPGSEACIGLSLPTGTPPFTYEWSRAGATLDGRFKTSVDAGGVRLTVSSAQIGDSGVYTLQASNDAGKDTTRVSLEVSPDETPTGDDPPTFLRRLQDLTVKVGTRTRFLVEILSSTECKVTWYRNDRRLLEAERIALVRDGNFWCADVATVSVDDAGRWTCTAENLGGRASCSAHLNVLVPKAYKRPEFVEELRAILTEQGTVSLECKVVGVPTPVLRWFKDSREIKAGDVFALTANADDPTSLGTYTCEAINCMGRAYSSSKVHVIGRSKEGSDMPSFGGLTPDPPPIFTKELEDQFIRICDNLSLGCQIVVPPWPRSVVWYNKEGKIDPSTKYNIIEDGVGSYVIEVAASEWADEGEWKCVATSAGGRVGISTCSVTMDVPKNYRKPRFMENLQAVLTEEGLVSFECKVVGFPTPVLNWFKDGQELKPGDVYQLTGTNSLGSYCCIARNCMGQASSSAELTVEDIQNQLNEDEKLQLFSQNQAPKFLQGLKSVEVKIDEPFRFTIKVVIPPEPTVLWYRDDQPMDESPRCHLGQEDRGLFYLDIKKLELMDQTEWKCVAMNDYGHSVTSCFLKLVIPRHYKKPRFLENLQAILSDEGAVNLECKVIGVPQPVLKWYKDGEELKPGDIHRIISGQDGTCCLGTYTCEAQNCMGIAASSASLLGFEDTVKTKKKRTDEQILQRNLSLSTIHEERTSQMYDTPVADVTLDEKGEISFSFDGKEVSVSLYETPDLTEEEALQIVEMYADQLSENVTEHNVVELPPLRFVKETSTSGNLLMEAIIIDVSPDYFVSPEEDLRTEADIEDISIAEENGQAQLSFDQEISEEYIEKTMALLSDEKTDIHSKPIRRKSDSQKSGEDYFSLSRDQSLSDEKKDDDTQILSDSVSFASAHSIGKQKSKPSQEDEIRTQESSDVTKTVLLREEFRTNLEIENTSSKIVNSTKRDSLKSITDFQLDKSDFTKLNENIMLISSRSSKILHNVQTLERDIVLQSQLLSTAAIATKSLEIINSIINPVTEIYSLTEAFKETIDESFHAKSILLTKFPQCLKDLQNSLVMVEKCIDVGRDKTLINNTCISVINNCEEDIITFLASINEILEVYPFLFDTVILSEIKMLTHDILRIIDVSKSTIATKSILYQEIKKEELSIDKRHLNNTQKAIYNLKVPVNSLLDIIENALNKTPLNPSVINNAEVILFNMSSSIQDLQAGLEHIEVLSVEESNSSLEKYNTMTIETVIGSVLKLRNAFESLSFEKEKKYDRGQLQSLLEVIKVDLQEISSHIEDIEKKIGQFDVLYAENKLEILQRMAHILISLEKYLPLLHTLPNVQRTVSTFHKNLTKALENVIESNESAKYCTLLCICDVVSRIIVSIKEFDSEQCLSLTSIGNNLSIIEDILKNHCIDKVLAEEMIKNVYQYYVDIQDVMTGYAEDISIQMDSEPVEDISIEKCISGSKANTVVQHINQVIAVINNITPEELTPNLCHILPVLQNTCPVLEELKYTIASLELNIQEDSHASDTSQSLIELCFGNPLKSMHENIIVLNQVLLETIADAKPKDDSINVFAKPLYELYTTLQTLQENILSQYENFSVSQNSVKIANTTEVLKSCILIVEEQCDLGGFDDMSTLQDISCIKTTADAISENNLLLPFCQEIVVETPIINSLKVQPKIASEFQKLHNDIKEIQKLDILEALNTLSDVKEYENMKSVTTTIEEIQHKIVGILSPLVMESLSSVSNLNIASSNLTNISESLFKLKNHLTVIDFDNIPIYEDVLKIPSNKIHSIVKNISNLKEHLDKCILSVQQSTDAIGFKDIQDLCNICNNFKSNLNPSVRTNLSEDENMLNLMNSVENFLQVIKTTSDLSTEKVKIVSEGLYKNVMLMEDSMIQYTCPTEVMNPEPLEEIIHELACNVAVLVRNNLTLSSELSSDYADKWISEKFNKTDYLTYMENVLQNNVQTIQDISCHSQNTEIQKKEFELILDFLQNCKNRFSIIRIILTQRPSKKKIFRLFQEYFALQAIIKQFIHQKSTLSCKVPGCLDNFLNQADYNLEKIKISLINISYSLSRLLYKEPLIKINDCIDNFPNYLKLDSILEFHDLIQNFLISVNIAAPHLENLEENVVKELNTCIIINSCAENKLIMDSLDNFMLFLEREMTDNPNQGKQILLRELIKCLKTHQDYKNAEGTGKRMIILKCLSDCSDILRNHFRIFDTENKIVETTQRRLLQSALNELIGLFKSLNLQINEVQENDEVKSLSIKEEEIDSSMKNIMSLKDSCEKYLDGINQNSLSDNDISVIHDIFQEIHLIQDNINTLQSDSSLIVENLKSVEDFIASILPIDDIRGKCRELSKAETNSFLQHVEKYIEVTEIIEEISAVINLGKIKETKEIAQELRECLAADETLTIATSEEIKHGSFTNNQENLAQLLQKSLSNIQESDLTSCDNTIKEHILEAITQLQDDLKDIAITKECKRENDKILKISTDKDNILAVNEIELSQNIVVLPNSLESNVDELLIQNQSQKTNNKPVIHQIDDTISSICGIVYEAIPTEIKHIYPALENICPILEELKISVASLQENVETTDSPVSDITESLVEKAFSKTFRELEENISVLNQLTLESFNDTLINENIHTVGVLAKALHELHITYQTLQESVISQYESLSSLHKIINFAETEEILHNCILFVQQPYEVETADEMSTLEDISFIKTTADSILSDVHVVAQETKATTQEYIDNNKSEYDKLSDASSVVVQEANNMSVSIELQETMVFIEEDNKKIDFLEIIEQSVEPVLEVTQNVQVTTEVCIDSSKDSISELIEELSIPQQSITQEKTEFEVNNTNTVSCHTPPIVVNQEKNAQEAIDKYNKDNNTLCEIIKTDADIVQEIQIGKKEENISELIEPRFLPEEAIVQETQTTQEEYIQTNETKISSFLDSSDRLSNVKSEQGITHETIASIIKENIKTDENKSSDLFKLCVKPEEEPIKKTEAPSEVCIERSEENLSEVIEQPIILEQEIQTKSNISSQLLQPEKAIAKETIVSMDEDIERKEINSSRVIEPCIEFKQDNAQKIQIPTEECTERGDQTIFDHGKIPIECIQATPELEATEEQCILNNEPYISSSPEQSPNSEQVIVQETILTKDQDIKIKIIKSPEIVETSFEHEQDASRKTQVPTTACVEGNEENISEHIEPTIRECVVVEQIESSLKECFETSDKNSSDLNQQASFGGLQNKLTSLGKICEENFLEKSFTTEENNKNDNSIPRSTEHPIVPENANCQETDAASYKLKVIDFQKDISGKLTNNNSKGEINNKYVENSSGEKLIPKDLISNEPEKIDEANAADTSLAQDLLLNIQLDDKKSTPILAEINQDCKPNYIIQTMDSLLNELDENLNPADKASMDNTDALQNILDELQVQIIKLKSVNIKSASGVLNETVEDLECSVRSVQLLVTENSPADHIIEASETIKLLVNSIKDELTITPMEDSILTKTDILGECIGDTETTLLLLDKLSDTTSHRDDLSKIFNDLNCVKDSIKIIKESFTVNEETVIEQGIEILQRLDTIEHQLFNIEGDIGKTSKVDSLTRDTIFTAVHSVYTNISNIRGTISNIQKRYIHQNYGKPSENLLKAIKNINAIKKIDDKKNWISVTKHFRNILNHFEEIKFYINLDRTARQPSDSSLTKIVLNELRLLMESVILTNIKELQLPLEDNVDLVIKFVEECILQIDDSPIIEVREKIPIFKGLTVKLIELTNEMLVNFEKHKNNLSVNSNEFESQKKVISFSISELALEESITKEIETDMQTKETSKLVVNATTIESLPSETTISCDSYNIENNIKIKDSVQPIIEDLVEEAINKVLLLLKGKNRNKVEFDDKDDSKDFFAHSSHEEISEGFTDKIEIQLITQLKCANIEIDNIVEKQLVSGNNQLNLEKSNIERCDEKFLVTDNNNGPYDDIEKNSSAIKYQEDSNQIKSDFTDMSNELMKTSVFKQTEDKEEFVDFKEVKINEAEASKKSGSIVCQNIQENVLLDIEISGEEGKNDSFSQLENDPLNILKCDENILDIPQEDTKIHDSFIEHLTSSQLESQEKILRQEELMIEQHIEVVKRDDDTNNENSKDTINQITDLKIEMNIVKSSSIPNKESNILDKGQAEIHCDGDRHITEIAKTSTDTMGHELITSEQPECIIKKDGESNNENSKKTINPITHVEVDTNVVKSSSVPNEETKILDKGEAEIYFDDNQHITEIAKTSTDIMGHELITSEQPECIIKKDGESNNENSKKTINPITHVEVDMNVVKSSSVPNEETEILDKGEAEIYSDDDHHITKIAKTPTDIMGHELITSEQPECIIKKDGESNNENSKKTINPITHVEVDTNIVKSSSVPNEETKIICKGEAEIYFDDDQHIHTEKAKTSTDVTRQEYSTSDILLEEVIEINQDIKQITIESQGLQILQDETPHYLAEIQLTQIKQPDKNNLETVQSNTIKLKDQDIKQEKETENYSKPVNEVSNKTTLDSHKTIPEIKMDVHDTEPVNQQQKNILNTKLININQPELIEYLSLNEPKEVMTLSNIDVQLSKAIVSEPNATDLQNNLDVAMSTLSIISDSQDNFTSVDSVQSTFVEIEECADLPSASKILKTNIQEPCLKENLSNIELPKEKDIHLEPEEYQGMCYNIQVEDTDQAKNNKPMGTSTAEDDLASSSIKPTESCITSENVTHTKVKTHDTAEDITVMNISRAQAKDPIINTEKNNIRTSVQKQTEFPLVENIENIKDIKLMAQKEIHANGNQEDDNQISTSVLDTQQTEGIQNKHTDNIITKEKLKFQDLELQIAKTCEVTQIEPKRDINLFIQNEVPLDETQYRKGQENTEEKQTESKLETNGLMKNDSPRTREGKKNKRKKSYEDVKVTKQKIQDYKMAEVTKSDNYIGDHIGIKDSDISSRQILDSKSYETPETDKEIEFDQKLTSKGANTTASDVSDKRQFIDVNLTDMSMEFSRPPGYIPKSINADNLLTPEINTYISKSNKIYKAQSLLRDSESKTIYTSDHDGTSKDKQLKTKAISETRSTYSDRRASSTRDLKRKPVFTTHLTNRTAVEGSRVKLTCSVLSSTEPVLKWHKNGVLLDDKHKYKIKFNDGLITMELLNAFPSDSGDYSCTVENEHGSITTLAKLKVYPSFEATPIPPTFTRSIRDVYHRAENELVLECRIRGQPLPMISWFKDNQLINMNDRYETSYIADGLCRLTIHSPTKEDSGTYTCKAESAIWTDQITHVVNFADSASRLDSHISSVERLRLSHDTRRPHFTNVLSDYKVVKGGTIGLQVEIGGAPTRVEWLREGSSVTELDRNAQTFVDHGIYTLALSDVSEKHSGLYTCRAWGMHGNVDMNAEINVVQPNDIDGKPPVIVSRPAKDLHISVGEDINISFRVQGEPRPKVFIMKGIRDITNSQRVCKMTSDDYVKFTVKRSVISDAGTYCILARNLYGCDRGFVTVTVRQRASSDNLISDWTYPADEPSIVATDRKYKSVPERIPGEPSAVDGGNNWLSLSWPKSGLTQDAAPVLAYRVDSWLLGKEGGARWIEMGITPRNTFDAFNLKQGGEYHFRVTPRNRYGWGEPVQTSNPIEVGISGDRPEFIDILPGLLKVLVGETASLSCSFKGKPTPDIAWMKNGREIEETSKVRSRQIGNVCSLTLNNVEIEDEGRYSCEATNAHGRASTYARMTVISDRQIWEADAKLKRERSADATGEYPPQFTMRLRDRRVQATYPVRLTCQVIGSPKPAVTWYKDGQEVIFDGRKTKYQDEHFHTLEIAPTTLDDGGLYEALARNNSGAVSCRCNLVVDKGIRAYIAPEFCCGLEPLYRLNEGDELRVSAIVEAYPSVGVTWYRDGVRLRPSRRAIMTLDRDGQIELALASLTPRDAGVYTCTASNEVGQASTSGKVVIVTDQREERRKLPTVICSDVPCSKEPMFTKKPRSTEAQEGDTVIIECEVIGDPTPDVYWLRDFLKPDYYRDAKHFKQMAAGPLYRFEIPHAKLDYTGAYSVVARNVHGEAKAIISLQILAKDLRSNDETHNIRYGRVEVIPRFEKELTDLLCYDSDAIEFECLVSGNPEPDIRWFHYNQILPDCPEFESTYDLGTARLKIRQVAAEDEGTYTCEASNNLGKATSTACLVVYPPGEPNTLSQRLQRPPALASAASTPRSTPRVTPARSMSRTPARSGPESRRLRSPTREVGPKFYTYPFNKVVEEGDSVVLQCAVGGFPTPWATWDKDGIIITPTSRISVKEKDEMLRILQIDEVNVDDVGLYRITLENDFGRAEASARLEVISHKGKFHSRSSSVSPARFSRRRTPSYTRQD